jgi:hypothetical protein
VEGAEVEGPSGCQGAGEDENLSFVGEAADGFFWLGELGGEDLVEDGGVGEVLVRGVGAGFDVGYLLDDVLFVVLACCGIIWGRETYSSLC